MPRIFDKIDTKILAALRGTLPVSRKGDFCVGYFIASAIARVRGDDPDLFPRP